MKNIVREICFAAFKSLANIVLIVPSFIRVHVPFRKKIIKIVECASAQSSDYAVVAIHEPNGLSTFTRNLIDGLVDNKINIVLVSNCPLSTLDREQVTGKVFVLIERENLGRDFGAYQAGVRYLLSSGNLASCRKLLLLNDSAFYGKAISRQIREILSLDAPFVGLYETFQYHYHVNAFFLCFSHRVALSEAFKVFWENYKPYSTRYHCIFAGEVRLSKLLMDQNITPFIVYSTNVIRTAILRLRSEDTATFITRLAACIPESWLEETGSDRSGQVKMHLHHKSLIPTTDVESQLVAVYIQNCERANQAHALGLCSNRLLGAPLIKKDLCYRGLWSIATLTQLVDGFTEDERAEMLAALRRRSVPQAFSGFRRLRLVLDA